MLYNSTCISMYVVRTCFRVLRLVCSSLISLFTNPVYMLLCSFFIWSNTNLNYSNVNNTIYQINTYNTKVIMDCRRLAESVTLLVAVLVPSVAAVINLLI